MDGGKVAIEVRGIPVVFDNEAMSSFSILRKIAHVVDGTNVFGVVDVMEAAFGSEQLDNIERTLGGDGVCTAEEMSAFFFEAMQTAAEEAAGEAKN